MTVITMKRRISGTRDGADWPEPGQTIDVPDEEAASLIMLDMAAPAEPEPVEESRKGARRATNEPTS